jgi:hypothetical protein
MQSLAEWLKENNYPFSPLSIEGEAKHFRQWVKNLELTPKQQQDPKTMCLLFYWQ